MSWTPSSQPRSSRQRRKQQAESADAGTQQAEELKAATQSLEIAVEKSQAAAKQAGDEELGATAKRLHEILVKKEADLADQAQAAIMAANKAKEANRAQVLSQRRFETVQEQVEAARSKQAAGRQLLDRQAAEVAELKRSLAEADVAAESFRKQLESLRQQELAARRL